MYCCGKNIDVEEGKKRKPNLTIDTQSPAKKLSAKSSESLARDLKEYYMNSPERRHRVLVVNRQNFFDNDDDLKQTSLSY